MNLRALDMGLPYKAKKGEKAPEYSQVPMEGWKYTPVKVPVNFGKTKEKEFMGLIQKLKKEKIDKTGLRFQLGNENSYGDLVKLLNLMEKTQQSAYGAGTEKTNSLYVLYYKPDKNLLQHDHSPNAYINQTDYEYQTASFWEKLIRFSPNGSYFLIFGYLMLVYCSFLKPKLARNI
jgi:hypothetical protein